jgi:MFS family permease
MHLPPALKHRPFLLYWIGLMISITGSQMQLWVLYWHLRTLSNQPMVISGIGLARFLPVVILSLFAGVTADHFNRRKLAIITQIGLGLVAAILGTLTASGKITLWMIYVLVVFQAIAVSFDLPARQALIPALVSREDLPNAFSMNSIAANVGAIVGPACSGLLIGYIGLQWAYWFNAVSYIAVIAALILMGDVQGKVEKEPIKLKSTMFDIREGIKFIVNSPVILSSMILDFFATFFSSANTLLPFVAQDVLHVNAIQYGWLSASQSIGDVSVALFLSQKGHIRRQGLLLSIAVVIFGLATILFGLSTGFWLTMVALIMVGAADGFSTIIRNTLRQLQTPDELRGRMVAINQIFFKGGPELGEVEAGLVAQAFGVPAAIITGGVGCILAVGIVVKRFPQLIHFNGDEPMVAVPVVGK